LTKNIKQQQKQAEPKEKVENSKTGKKLF